MNTYSGGGNVLGAAISVLPATAAFAYAPSLMAFNIAETVAVVAVVWGLSYVAITNVINFLRR